MYRLSEIFFIDLNIYTKYKQSKFLSAEDKQK